nr:hypothetical protein BgiMline_027799 [Biomphalaria glabrata]
MTTGQKHSLGELMLCKEDFNKNPYPDFNWWNDTVPQKKAVFLRKDELPIPKLPDRYPYRYTSAGPCSVGRTAKEMDIYRMSYKVLPKIKAEDKLDVRMINQVRGYETTSMTASLQPFRSSADHLHMASLIPFGLNHNLNGTFVMKHHSFINLITSSGVASRIALESLYVPFQSQSKFDKYVVNLLHPGWRNDPLYRRCIKFGFQESPEDSGPTEVSRR